MKIELITCESGDWEVLKVDGEVRYEGHSIKIYECLELLEELGCDIFEKEISDDDMEMGDY